MNKDIVKEFDAPKIYCPVCDKEAHITHALTAMPPIYVYSCGCKVRYTTKDNTKEQTP